MVWVARRQPRDSSSGPGDTGHQALQQILTTFLPTGCGGASPSRSHAFFQASSLRKGDITEIDRDKQWRRNLVLSVVKRINPGRFVGNQDSVHVTVIQRIVDATGRP